ncbi:MAG: hypothetical protein LASZOEIN_001892, partial [Candidatus Fervidibacter sp.]
PARPKNFSTAVTVPCDFSPNEFGAQEKSVINHWLKPVAWAEKIVKGLLLHPFSHPTLRTISLHS